MYLSGHHRTGIPDTTVLIFIMQVSFMQFLMVSLKKELVFFFCFFFPLNRLPVYEGSLYRLKCIVKQQMRKKMKS